jgi:hypothetical protein
MTRIDQGALDNDRASTWGGYAQSTPARHGASSHSQYHARTGNLARVSDDDADDLETLAPAPVVEPPRSPTPPSLISRWIVVAASGALLAMAVVLIITAVQLSDLRRRVHRLEDAAPPTTTTTVAETTASHFCLSYPLVGDITYRTDTGYISGDVGGLPPYSDVRMELWDAGKTPAKIVAKKVITTNANGASHLFGPTIGRPAYAWAIFFRVVKNAGDAGQLFGPPAYPC